MKKTDRKLKPAGTIIIRSGKEEHVFIMDDMQVTQDVFVDPLSRRAESIFLEISGHTRSSAVGGIPKDQAGACREIARILEAVDNRCMAGDGPVSETREEITGNELRRIYLLAKRGAGKR